MVYPILPDEIPTHWNIQGQVDGTMPVFPGALLIPALMVGITLLMIILPRYDPKWEAYQEFQGAYDALILLLNIFFFLLFLITILWALRIEVPMNQVISALFRHPYGGNCMFYPSGKAKLVCRDSDSLDHGERDRMEGNS
jgi:Predicted integral membrane protein